MRVGEVQVFKGGQLVASQKENAEIVFYRSALAKN